MYIFEQRASTILYNYLLSAKRTGVYILPGNICPIVVTTFIKAKAKYEFCDISKHDLCLDQEQIMDKITKYPNKYAGILYSHTYGIPSNPLVFFNNIKDINPNLIIIDDKCLCKPSFKIHTFVADLTLFSTGYSKYVDLGYGGYGLTSSKYTTIDYRHHDTKYKDKHHLNLTNQFRKCITSGSLFQYKDSDWLDSTPPIEIFSTYRKTVELSLPKAASHKYKLNKIYRDHLPKQIVLPNKLQVWRFSILVPDKEDVIKRIFSQNLFVSSHYYPANKMFNGNKCPVAEKLYRHVINLFNDFRFTPKQAIDTCRIINKYSNDSKDITR